MLLLLWCIHACTCMYFTLHPLNSLVTIVILGTSLGASLCTNRLKVVLMWCFHAWCSHVLVLDSTRFSPAYALSVVSPSLRPQPQSFLPSQGERCHSILLRCSVVPNSLCLPIPHRLLCKSTRYVAEFESGILGHQLSYSFSISLATLSFYRSLLLWRTYSSIQGEICNWNEMG